MNKKELLAHLRLQKKNAGELSTVAKDCEESGYWSGMYMAYANILSRIETNNFNEIPF